MTAPRCVASVTKGSGSTAASTSPRRSGPSIWAKGISMSLTEVSAGTPARLQPLQETDVGESVLRVDRDELPRMRSCGRVIRFPWLAL